MTTARSKPVSERSWSDRQPVPPLANGDQMTRAEFERRWEAMPQLKKAELVNGVVYMHAALRADQHGIPHARLMGWLMYYLALTPGLEVGDNTSDRIDEDNMPQADAYLRIPEKAGGRSRIDEDGYLRGGPELVAEVSASSTSIDLHQKLHLYRRAGVNEYIVWRVLDQAIDWFVIREGAYELQEPDAGIYKSTVFPGLWLDVQALLEGEIARVFDVVREGASGDEHEALLRTLREAIGRA